MHNNFIYDKKTSNVSENLLDVFRASNSNNAGNMGKNITSLFKSIITNRKERQKKMGEILGKDINCYVLITCSNPNRNGKMNVDLIYEGDRELAAYLIQSAQGSLE